MSWTDDEVGLLLGVVLSYNSQKDYEGLERESVKNKYEDIRKDFAELYQQGNKDMEKKSLPHDVALFTRERIASKIKDP